MSRRRLLLPAALGAGWLLSTAASAAEPEGFWRAVKALAFDEVAVREAQGEQREYALALQRTIEGDEAAEDALRRLCEAGDPEVREQSRRLYAGLLAAGSRWAELEDRQRETEIRPAERRDRGVQQAAAGKPDLSRRPGHAAGEAGRLDSARR